MRTTHRIQDVIPENHLLRRMKVRHEAFEPGMADNVARKFLEGRTPVGATDRQLHQAADKFFSAVASDIGRQDTK